MAGQLIVGIAGSDGAWCGTSVSGRLCLEPVSVCGTPGQHVGHSDDADVSGDDVVASTLRDDRQAKPREYFSGSVDFLYRNGPSFLPLANERIL